jgi:hypothetical protein
LRYGCKSKRGFPALKIKLATLSGLPIKKNLIEMIRNKRFIKAMTMTSKENIKQLLSQF